MSEVKSDKLKDNMQGLANALLVLEKSLDMGAQSDRFRNAISRSEFDKTIFAAVTVIKRLTDESNELLQAPE